MAQIRFRFLACALALVDPGHAAVAFGPPPAEIPVGVTVERERDARGHLEKLVFRDVDGEAFHAWAELTDGELVLRIRARADGRRSRHLYGRDVIRIAVHEFGPRVDAVQARWTDGDNRDAYDLARAEGRTKRRAAAGTWTARALARVGFTRITGVRVWTLFPGTTRVDVTFRRPWRRRCEAALTAFRGSILAKLGRMDAGD